MQRSIILFFIFFLTSRFFSEVLGILPKWLDLIDYPFMTFFIFISLFFKPSQNINKKEHSLFSFAIFSVIVIALISSLINSSDFLLPATLLFIIGFLEGPLLYFALNKIVVDVDLMVDRIKKLFFYLLFINFFIVIFLNIPQFIETKNPDVIAGSYGLNQYYFSILLVICGGLILGEAEFKKRNRIVIIFSQAFIFVTYILLQFRAGLPFFLFSYGIVILILYGRQIRRVVFLGFIILMLAGSSLFFVLSKAEEKRYLKYDDWLYILNDPISFLQYGKFKVYPQTIKMILDEPLRALVGVGPGNFLSRAYYTFSYEMMSNKSKGVAKLASDIFGLSGPRFTSVSDYYLIPTQTGVVLGTNQFQNPNSSFVAPIAELGLIGGFFIIGLYLYLLRKSVHLLRIAKSSANEYLPQVTALAVSSIYLFGLAFLDNYWEMSRATLPVWLLFWGTSAGIELKIKRLNKGIDEKSAKINLIQDNLSAE